MKAVKLLPAVFASVVLAACSTSSKDMVEAAAPAMSEQAVVYKCHGKKNVVISYTFADQKAVSAKVMLNKKAVGGAFERKDRDAESVNFVSGDYVLSLEHPFSAANAKEANLVMITKMGKETDAILAKACEINKKATAKLNK